MGTRYRKAAATVCCLTVLSHFCVGLALAEVHLASETKSANPAFAKPIGNFILGSGLNTEAEFYKYCADYYWPSPRNVLTDQLTSVTQNAPVKPRTTIISNPPIHVDPFSGQLGSRKGQLQKAPRKIRVWRSGVDSMSGTAADNGAANGSMKIHVSERTGSLTVKCDYPTWSNQVINDLPLPGIVLTFSEDVVRPDLVASVDVSSLATISPPVDGRWTCMNPRTLLFQPSEKGFERGTTYSVMVEAGVSSLSGKVLSQTFKKKFSTSFDNPILKEGKAPNSIVLQFQQDVAMETILPRVKAKQLVFEQDPVTGVLLNRKSENTVELRLGSESESRRIVGVDYIKDRSVALIPKIPLADGARLEIIIEAGIRSRKGEASTSGPVVSGLFFQPRSEVNVVNTDQVFEPGQPLVLAFDNFVGEGNSADDVTVEPSIEGFGLQRSTRELIITGKTVPETTYAVSIKRGFKTSDGNTFSKDRVFRVRVGSYAPRLIPPAHPFQLCHSFDGKTIPIQSVNVPKIRVKIYDAALSRVPWVKLQPFASKPPVEDSLLGAIEIAPRAPKNEVSISRVNLARFFEGGKSQLLVTVEQVAEQAEGSDSNYSQLHAYPPIRHYTLAIQASDISVTCIPALDRSMFFVSDAITGKPIVGAKVTLSSSFGYAPAEGDSIELPSTDDSNKPSAAFTDKDGIAIFSNSRNKAPLACVLVEKDKEKIVIAAGRNYLETELHPALVRTPVSSSNTQLSFNLPFEKSRGVFICNNGQEVRVIPVEAYGKQLRMFVPQLTPEHPIGHCYLKVFNEGSRSRKHLAKSAMCSVFYGAIETSKVEIRDLGWSLRDGLSITSAFVFAPTEMKDAKADWTLKQFGYNFSTSTAGIPSPRNCPVVNVSWQVRELHRVERPSSHLHMSSCGWGNSPPSLDDLFPLIREPADQLTVEKQAADLLDPAQQGPVVTLFVPKVVHSGDIFSLPLKFENPTNDETFQISIREKGGQVLYTKDIDIKSGTTEVFIDNFSKFDPRFSVSRLVLTVMKKQLTYRSNSGGDWSFELNWKSGLPGQSEQIRTGTSPTKFNDDGQDVELCSDSEVPVNSVLEVSNDLTAFIENQERKLVAAPIRSVIQRATRVLALCERRRQMVGDAQKKFDKMIESEVEKLLEARLNNNDWMSWFPDGANVDNHAGRIFLPIRMVNQALEAAALEGLTDSAIVQHSQYDDIYAVTDSLVPEYARAQAFSVACLCLHALLSKSEADRDALLGDASRIWDFVVPKLKVDELRDESIAHLAIASRILQRRVSQAQLYDERLDSVVMKLSGFLDGATVGDIARNPKTYTERVDNFVHPKVNLPLDTNGNPQDIPSVYDSITATSLLLLAYLGDKPSDFSKRNPEPAETLATFLEGTGHGGAWNNMSAGLALQALYRFRSFKPEKAVGGSAHLDQSQHDFAVSFPAGKHELKQAVLTSTEGHVPTMTLSPDLRYGINSLVFCKQTAKESRYNLKYRVKRIFFADPKDNSNLQAGEPVWQSPDGTWHCKRNATLTMRLFILPDQRRDFIATVIPACAGLEPKVPSEEITYDSAPLREETNAAYRELYNRWAQKIEINDTGLELYSRSVSPQLYRFDYKFKTPMSGRFFVPAVSIDSVFESVKTEYIDHTTLEVED
ncbi:hypothetical protein KF728_07295 [Candidatus Obscuribacterales bacterium]|nr:hypothetical protein [Candidatus Obscuribacterales bacterium]MBX3149932.1 hypothetical protein [Candidatus Obscuribacterales bacterium]